MRSAFLAVIAMLSAGPALAQMQSDNEAFIAAVRERDGPKAVDIFQSRGPIVVNARSSKGETPLIVAIGNRDSTWTRFLLQKGADPNLPEKSGETPLIAASRNGFVDAVEWLLESDAKVDEPNRKGETALIVAVQQRQTAIVRALLKKGADADRTDNVAGFSARDYARRDTRSRDLLRLIEAADSPSD